MEVLSIDIGGKFAHFRKYYGNNTALSHTIPPRTTIMGMLAAIMGRERDSYYEDFASDKIRIGVQILTPLKKTFHRLNLLKIGSSEDDFRGAKVGYKLRLKLFRVLT
jgi:CRISPR-associated protein Cas5h